MVQKVTKYIAEDGTEFDAEEDAILYEKRGHVTDALYDKLYGYTTMGSSECHATAQELVRHFNITVKE